MRDGRHLALAPLPRVRPAPPTRIIRRAGGYTFLLIAAASLAATSVRWSREKKQPLTGKEERIEFTASTPFLRLPPVQVIPPASTAPQPPTTHAHPPDALLTPTPTLLLTPPEFHSLVEPSPRISVTDPAEFLESLPRLQPAPSIAPAPAAPSSPTITAPVPLRQASPIYPALARRRGWEGTCHVTVHIDKSGRVTDAKVRTSSGHRVLDDAALRTIRRWTFRPGTVDKLPASSEADVPVVFSLQ